jgi:uncharacterized protein (TIGR02246 family)
MTDDLRLGDRLALRQLVEAYARCVDRLELSGVAALFTVDGVLSVHPGDPATTTASSRHEGRDAITAGLQSLRRYEVTTHVLGQQSLWFSDDGATGETYCLAHHIRADPGGRVDRTMAIRYQDTYAHHDGAWRFAIRRLAVDWVDERPMSS